jgi:hypothetical protein
MSPETKTPSSSKSVQQLLCSREQVREMLGGVSRHTVWRLQRAGKLKPVRLSATGAVQSRVYYRVADVLALVNS